MNVTTKLKMDLSKPDFGLSVDAVQGDSYTRSVRIALYSRLQPWNIPEGVTAAIRYAKPDHTKGYYDTLPNGESAWSYQENVLTVQLAPQMLTVAGDVEAQIELIRGALILSTFRLIIHVEPNPAAGVMKSENYVNWLQWIQEQSNLYALQVQQAAQLSHQSAQEASQSAENAEVSADSANISAKSALDAAASANNSQKEIASIAAEVSAIVAGNEAYTKRESDSRYSPVIIQSTAGKKVVASDSTDVPLQNLKLFGKTIQRGTPTPEAPAALESVGDDGSVTVTVRGANMVNINNVRYNASNGGTMSVNGDVITGSSNKGWGQIESKNFPSVPGATMYLSCKCITGGNKAFIRCVGVNAEGTSTNFGSHLSGAGKVAVTVPENAVQVRVRMYINGTSSELAELVEASFDSVMLSYMDVDYEPFKEETNVTVSTPNGLPGIPVSSGGNYTDENGQQWICDEVNFEKGQYIQRIGFLDDQNEWGFLTESSVLYVRPMTFGFSNNALNTNSDINFLQRTNLMCNLLTFNQVSDYRLMPHGSFRVSDIFYIKVDGLTSKNAYLSWMEANDFKLTYFLPKEIVHTLSEEELAQYAELHSNYPNTIIYNDKGSDMELKYVADTKMYIDRKYNDLAAALVYNI